MDAADGSRTECTYDQPSNRRRNPAPQYVENLEHRVHRAESLLHILIPNLDLNDPGIDAAVAQGWIPGAPGKGRPVASHEPRTQRPSVQPLPGSENKSDTNIEAMMKAVAQLDMDEAGNWDYHGHSSGLSFVRRMREQLGDLMGPETVSTPFVKNRPLSHVLDSPKSVAPSADSPAFSEPTSAATDLPPKHMALETCKGAVDEAAALFRVVHKPSFWQSVDRLYAVPQDQWSNEDHKFLPLFHAALALGHLFSKPDQTTLESGNYESAIQQGFVHFRLARSLMDIADCRDLMSIQAVVFMIQFLQSSARLSQCYAYIGVALRNALRMGLHRNFRGNFDPIEAETRKRVFWVIRKMDIYVGAMLGLPQTLSEDDIDQELPVEVDDEYITKDGIRPMPDGQVSLMTAFNAHTRLVTLLIKVMRHVYPIKVQGRQGADKSYSVPYSIIRELEGDLEQWKTSLPPVLNPSQAPARYTRVQQLLRLAYAHVQVMLYRPFLHFVAAEKRQSTLDQRAYACAASYVNVSRNIIHITTQMKQKGFLNGAFWFIMYTSFFSVLSLVYFAAENPDNPTTEAVMKDAHEGRQTLAQLSKRSMAADRCAATLDVIFQRLPDWLREGRPNPVTSRKRQFESGMNTPSQLNPQASRSHPDVSTVGQNEPMPGMFRRASTFPQRQSAATNPAGAPPTPFDTWSQSGASPMGPQTPSSNDFTLGPNLSRHPLSASAPGLGPNLPNYSLPGGNNTHHNFGNPALADLSSMMFPPADEPFGYPSQPLTTFENNQQIRKIDPFGGGGNGSGPAQFGGSGLDATSPMAGTPGSARSARDDNMEAQFFALPPFLEQQQRLRGGMASQPPPPPGMGFGGFGGPQRMGTPGMPGGGGGGGWTGGGAPSNVPPGDMTNINIHEIFSEAGWNPMLLHPGGGGYGQQ